MFIDLFGLYISEMSHCMDVTVREKVTVQWNNLLRDMSSIVLTAYTN